MICSICKKQIADNSKFCSYCGNKVIVTNKCPHCGSMPLPKDAKFCPDCGKPVDAVNTKGIANEPFLHSPLYLDLLSAIKELSEACDVNEAPVYKIDEENLAFYYDKLKQCRNTMSKLLIIANKYGVMDEWKKCNIHFTPSKVTKNIAPFYEDVKSPSFFANNYVLPYWPQRGKELSILHRNKLTEARDQIANILKKDISYNYDTYYRFIDTCIKAILDVNEGCDPYFRGYIQASNVQRYFWENMRAKFGEKNYNKFFHYHSGDFAEELYHAMRNIQ